MRKDAPEGGFCPRVFGDFYDQRQECKALGYDRLQALASDAYEKGIESERRFWRHSRLTMAILVQRLGGEVTVSQRELEAIDLMPIETSVGADGSMRVVAPLPKSADRR